MLIIKIVSISFILAISLLSGCGLLGPVNYVQPPPTQPYALLKIRALHHSISGSFSDEILLLNEKKLPLSDQPTLGEATSMARIRPEPGILRAATVFFHTETRTEIYQDTEQLQCGYLGSSGSSAWAPKYCTQTVNKTKLVTEKIFDARCTAVTTIDPKAGETYLLQYDFYGNARCELKCFLQTPAESGEFSLSPCH